MDVAQKDQGQRPQGVGRPQQSQKGKEMDRRVPEGEETQGQKGGG